MYRALPKGSTVEATPDEIVSLQVSLNSSPISIANGPLLQARAYVVGVSNPDTSFTIYVALLTDGVESSIFVSNPLKFPREEYTGIEVEALDLVEGHGFVMDRVDMRDASEVTEIIAELPLGARSVDPPARRVTRAAQRRSMPTPPPTPAAIADRYPPPPPLTVDSYDPRPTYGHQEPLPRRPGGPIRATPVPSQGRRMPSRALDHARGKTMHGTPIGALTGDLGMPPEEIIALLGRLMVLF